MAQVPLAILPAPEQEYLTKTELATFLRLQPEEIDPRVKAGVIPDGEVRPGKKWKTWTREAAAVAKFNLDNLHRYRGALERLQAEISEEGQQEE